MSLLIFILVLSILIIVHEFGHFFAAKKAGVRVERFSLGFGPRIFGKRIGDTEYLVCAIPLGGYVKMAGDNLQEFRGRSFEYLSKTPGQRATIVMAGPLLNYLMAFFCLWLIFWLGYPALTTRVGETLKDFPAEKAGIVYGDVIVSVDNKPVSHWEELQKSIWAKKQGQKVKLLIRRDGRLLKMQVALKQKELKGLLSEKRTVGLIGIKPQGEIIKIKHHFFKALFLSAVKLSNLTLLMFKAIWKIITGQVSFRESVTGPLGMFFVTEQAVKSGLSAIIYLMALLNVSLCIFNLLPIPVLDGGHLFLLGIERIKGKAMSQKVDSIITQLGMSLIILLAAIVFYNDLTRFGLLDKVMRFFRR
jgi:regulator of sigma E protease